MTEDLTGGEKENKGVTEPVSGVGGEIPPPASPRDVEASPEAAAAPGAESGIRQETPAAAPGETESAGILLESPGGRAGYRMDVLPWLLALFAVFAAALLWRWHFASRAHFYTYDSYYYMVLARNLRHGFDYSVAGHPHYKFMPMYPLTIAAFDLFLPLETAGKFSNVLFSAACVFPIYAIGALVFGRRAGLAAAGLFAFEPITPAWSSIPMSDGLLALLVCLGAFFFLKWMKKEEGGLAWFYASAGAVGLAMLTRWEGVLLLVMQALFILYYWWRRRLRFTNLLIFGLIAIAPLAVFAVRNLIVFGTPLKSAYLDELRNHPGAFEKVDAWGRLGRYFMFSDVEPLGISSRFYHYGYLIFGYTGLAFALALKRYRRCGLFILLWLLFLGPLHFFWYFASVRFLIPAVPALCLGAGALIGLPWVEVDRRKVGVALGVFTLLIMVALVGVLALTGRPTANDIFNQGIISLEDEVGGLAARDAVTWLRDNAGDAGVASNLGPMVSFYLGRDAYFLGDWQGFEPADIEIDDLVESARAKGVRYIVLWSWEPDVEAPLDYIGLGPEMLSRLNLVGMWEAPPTTQWNRPVYAWIFEIPPE
jgi:4-amino-4-deoxy-L-arabinose transferase-like glycosyltransferase